MKLINEDCGCDDDYFSVINNSPLLNGNQENFFNPTNNVMVEEQPLTKAIVFDKNNNNNINIIPKIESNIINQNKKINDNNIDMNNIQLDLTALNSNNSNNNVAMNNAAMNNAAMNNVAMNNAALNNIAANMNNASLNNVALNNRNGQTANMNNPNSLNSLNNINTVQELVYKNSNSNFNNDSNTYKNFLTTINYIFMVVLALALNDVSKYYINRAIKFQNGNHKYYLYYILILVFFVYLFSRKLNNLDNL